MEKVIHNEILGMQLLSEPTLQVHFFPQIILLGSITAPNNYLKRSAIVIS